MKFESVDVLQRTLADSIFQYAADRKKAAGRALGTLVELIAYYTLRTWELRDHIVIERSVPEFANPNVVHNVEFSLHSIRIRHHGEIAPLSLPITAAKVSHNFPFLRDVGVKSTQLLSRDELLRNSTVLTETDSGPVVANIDQLTSDSCGLTICELVGDPFAIFECKRVGVEEGMKKGPQTIEKAKQGAYVARSVSSLQKIRGLDGFFYGIIERDGGFKVDRYDRILRKVVEQPVRTRGVILTVGVVSNHGNWFTSNDHNKELRVLAQSYDWLLFLTDSGLAQFIDQVLLSPTAELEPARHAFLSSYSGSKKGNRFTKVRMDIYADEALKIYFASHSADVGAWYNVISPDGGTIEMLQSDLGKLAVQQE